MTKIDPFKLKMIEQRGHYCESCQLEKWLNEKIPLELHHIDGDHKNNTWDNVLLLCPNCHSFTPNYRGRGIKGRAKIEDSTIIKSAKKASNISELLVLIGLRPRGGNYQTIRRRLKFLGLLDKFTENKQCKINKVLKPRKCLKCKIEISGKNLFCSNLCANRHNRNGRFYTRKVVKRPTRKRLLKMISSIGYCAVGRMYGVSDNAIRKWLKSPETE